MGREKLSIRESLKERLNKAKTQEVQELLERRKARATQLAQEEQLATTREGKKVLKHYKNWQELNQMADDQLIRGGIESFHDIQAAILKISLGMVDLNKAIYGSTTGKLGASMLNMLKISAWIPATNWVSEKVSSAYSKLTGKDEPMLTYSAGVDNEGRLQTELSANGQPLTTEEEKAFDTAMLRWAKEKVGLQVEGEEGIIKQLDGSPITPEAFAEKLSDPQNGLHNFLKEQLDLDKIEQQQFAAPSVR